MSGKSQAKSISKVLPVERVLIEVIILALLGAAAVAIRSRLRIPVNMPGHHGLEVMALFMIARNFSKMPLAGTISAFGGAGLMLIPFFGFTNPFLPAIYIALGVGLDVLYYAFRSLKPAKLFFILMGGLAYTIIPLTRLLLHLLSVYPYQSIIKSGILYTCLSHFLYGAAGAVLAIGLIYSARKIKQ